MIRLSPASRALKYLQPRIPGVQLANPRITPGFMLTPASRVWNIPRAVIDGVSFVDCIFRGVRSTEVLEAGGSILFRNVKIEPAEKSGSLNSRPTWP
jgi:hypothetical protein